MSYSDFSEITVERVISHLAVTGATVPISAIHLDEEEVALELYAASTLEDVAGHFDEWYPKCPAELREVVIKELHRRLHASPAERAELEAARDARRTAKEAFLEKLRNPDIRPSEEGLTGWKQP